MYNKSNQLIPENDQQELWELNGRVKAFIAYAKLRTVVSHEEILAMLTGELPVSQKLLQSNSSTIEPWDKEDEI